MKKYIYSLAAFLVTFFSACTNDDIKKKKKGVSFKIKSVRRYADCLHNVCLKSRHSVPARAAFFYSFLSLRKVSTDIIVSITAAIQITTSIIVSTIPSLPSSFIQAEPVEFGRQPPTNGRSFIV